MRPRWARLSAYLTVVSLALAGCTAGGDQKDQSLSGDALKGAMVTTRKGLPADPARAAEALVAEILDGDATHAQAATAELLRRSGLPVVSATGPVIGMPDRIGLYDAPVYAELIPLLTTATRAHDQYTLDQVATVLSAVGLTPKPLTAAELAGALGAWGKESGDQSIFATAGAAIRALSARRGQVFYPGAPATATYLDPLQTVLVLAHATSRFAKVKGARPKAQGLGLLDRVAGTGVAYADDPAGPCGELAHLFDVNGDDGFLKSQAEADRDFLKDQLTDRVADAALSEGGKAIFDHAKEVAGRAGAALSAIMLMLGARLQLTSDKSSTHFKHQAGSRAEHVTLTALATYDFKTSLKKLECYNLAGVNIPKAGPLKDFTIRWSSQQPQRGTIQQGGDQYLQTVSADSEKILNGAKTGADGRATLEVKPPVEEPAGKGKELTGYATFTAQLDKEDFPLSLGDIFSALTGPLGFAIGKAFDLVKDVLTKAGLPAQSITIKVTYHGSDIIVAKGSGELNLILATIPKVYVDLVSCEGLTGPFKGHAGFGGTNTSGNLQALGKMLGVNVPENAPGVDVPISVMPTGRAGQPEHFHIVPGATSGWFLDGQITLYPRVLNTDAVLLDNYRVGRPVGEVELLPNGKTFPFANLTWPVARVTSDPRCPAVEYHYDDL